MDLKGACVTLTSPAFDLATFLSGALQLGQGVRETAKPPAASDSMLVSQASTSPVNDGRKRRRGDAINLANTLDGLVARRADDTHEPFQKRYLTEQEAIEGPDDEAEAKRMEGDPDVSTRTCSTCGYVGKWISEMIRHKRVHTNERPFKCRYCSRTSKWKADLIRHVAKTHGIRVVSKYSRSKAFDQTLTTLANRGDEDKPRVFACEPDKEPERQKQLTQSNNNADACTVPLSRPEPLLPGKTPLSYRCSQCFFEQAGLSILVYHLRAVHNKSPYECRCRLAFNSIGDALNHATTSPNCSSDDLVLNITPIYNTTYNAPSSSSCDSLSPSRSRSGCSPDSGVQLDIDETEMDRITQVYPKSTAYDSDNEAKLGLLTPPLFLSPSSTTSPLLSSLDLSSALLSLQLPLMPDFFAAMASLLNQQQHLTPMIETSSPPSHGCAQCGSRFGDIVSLIAHSRFHSAAPYPSASAGMPVLSTEHGQAYRDEMVDVEL